MEFLAPIHKCVLQIRQNLEMGTGLREVLSNYCRELRAPYAAEIGALMLGKNPERQLTRAERATFEVLRRGLAGEPVLLRLTELEEEFASLSQNAIERHLQRLPILLMLPLLTLVFPAVVLLLIGPIFMELISQLK